jgi:two-component sensor histidine kinase
MAAIHEQLTYSEKHEKVDFGKFMDKLAENLTASHSDFAGVISHHVEPEDISLDIESAIPCGMVVNELVSNAIKHAFPEGRAGTVIISLRLDRDGIFELRISDDGVGISSELDIRNTNTLGMQLVVMLVERQLQGSLEFTNDKGTEFTIRFRGAKSHSWTFCDPIKDSHGGPL